MYDVIVVGGGFAGLAAAQWLGRYRRATLVLGAGPARNAASTAAHGYFGRPDVEPEVLLDDARRDLRRYGTVEVRDGWVDAVSRDDDGFRVTTAAGQHRAHRLVLATGVVDTLPDIPGFDEVYGRDAFHCSACDAYEVEGQSLLAIGWGPQVAGFALDLLDWAARVTVVTAGNRFEGGERYRERLADLGIALYDEDVAALTIEDGRLSGARLSSGRFIPATRAFFSLGHRPRVDLAVALGCELDDDGYVRVDDCGETSVPGVFAAGDLTPGVQLVQTATAEGTIAGIAAARSLRGERTASDAPDPVPDPDAELPAAG